MIYFLKRKDGLVKIGLTVNYLTRLRQLEGEYGVLTLLGTMEGNKTVERDLHLQFSHCHDHREWFNLSPALSVFIAENTTMETIGVDKDRLKWRLLCFLPQLMERESNRTGYTLSQQKLADLSGVRQSQISIMCRGVVTRIDGPITVKLMQYFKLKDVGQLYDIEYLAPTT